MAQSFSKKVKNRLLALLLPPVINILIRFIHLTCKKRYHFNKEKVLDIPSVFVFWHGEIVMLPLGYINYRNFKNADIIASEHSDGDISSNILRLFGFGIIRGSSTRGNLKALKGAFKSLDNNRDIGITPDGPKGPIHSMANGASLIARKKNVPIIAMNCIASKQWRLKSWDRLSIPKPFSILDFYYSDPFYVTDESLEDANNIIFTRLMSNASKN